MAKLLSLFGVPSSSILVVVFFVLTIVQGGPAQHEPVTNWSPYTQSRKNPSQVASSRETSVDPSAAPHTNPFDSYSTLPLQDTPTFETQPQNTFPGFQQPQPQFQPQPQHYPQQQQQQLYDPYLNYQPVQSNEIEEEPGVFSRVMDFLGISGFFNRMSAAWSALTGSSEDSDGSSSSFMSRIAMPMMLLPMAAIPIGMGIMGLLAFPVLQLSLPVVRRSLSSTAALTSDVLGSEECAERISCTLARAAKKLPYEDWISSKLDKSENKWLSRMNKSLKAARSMDADCKQFKCGSISKLELMKESLLEGFKRSFVSKRKADGNISKSESAKSS